MHHQQTLSSARQSHESLTHTKASIMSRCNGGIIQTVTIRFVNNTWSMHWEMSPMLILFSASNTKIKPFEPNSSVSFQFYVNFFILRFRWQIYIFIIGFLLAVIMFYSFVKCDLFSCACRCIFNCHFLSLLLCAVYHISTANLPHLFRAYIYTLLLAHLE